MPVGADPEHRASTIEGQIARVADIIAYVNHDIDDAVRAGMLREEDLPPARVSVLGASSSERIGRMVTDVVMQTLEGGLTEIRMSDAHPRGDRRAAQLPVRGGLRERASRPRSSRRPAGILGGLWEKVRERPAEFLDRAHDRRGRPRRRRPGLPRRHDRPLRGEPLRAALHSEALGRYPHLTGPHPTSWIGPWIFHHRDNGDSGALSRWSPVLRVGKTRRAQALTRAVTA